MLFSQGDDNDLDVGDRSEEVSLSFSAIEQVVDGFSVATNISDSQITVLKSHILHGIFEDGANQPYHIPGFQTWLDDLETKYSRVELNDGTFNAIRTITNAILGVTFLREISRQSKRVSIDDLSSVWVCIRRAIASDYPEGFNITFSASRSAQGFLAIPLCSLVKKGDIEELFRIHVWLPDRNRGNDSFAIHSHQPFAQSWILAGEGRDHSYDITPASDLLSATHAEYELNWTDPKGSDTTYKTHQTSSTIVNTGNLVCAIERSSKTHTSGVSWWNHTQYLEGWRGTGSVTYTIPAAHYHSSQVAPDILHATLFYFDASRGFIKDARVLGPKDGQSFVQQRDPAGITAQGLVHAVDGVRRWEKYMSLGKFQSQRANWEQALRSLQHALYICERASDILNTTRYMNDVLSGIANTYRRFGRYEQARDILVKATEGTEPSRQRAEFMGELGVVYRHMNRLEDAKQAFEIQYSTAKQLNIPRAICRSVGNLGMINYQLFQQTKDSELLDLAISQLTERVQTARSMSGGATHWESIGLARLSICHSARGEIKLAVKESLDSLNLLTTATDPTVLAMTRFFYGRALLLDGQDKAALEQFNPAGDRGGCTPAIALCKEPSDEHRGYMKELVDAGANMDVIDEHGYTALDYAVFNGDTETETLVVEGLRRQFHRSTEAKLQDSKVGARLRKGYRELFQEKLRPLLLSDLRTRNAIIPGPIKPRISNHLLQALRQVYAATLAEDSTKAEAFDVFKFVPYQEFLRLGRLPGSNDGLATEWHDPGDVNSDGEVVIFLSYRWMNRKKVSGPDDMENTQYKRMVAAAEEFLELNPEIAKSRLRLWIVSVPIFHVILV